MSNLPQLAQLEFSTEDITESPESQRVHATLDWDFQKGDFRLVDGKTKTLTGKEYLKVWIEKALRTVRDELIYEGTSYGSEHHKLIGTTFRPSFTKAEIERNVREALLVNDAINSVYNFTFNQERAKLTVAFDVDSIFGVVQQQEVII